MSPHQQIVRTDADYTVRVDNDEGDFRDVPYEEVSYSLPPVDITVRPMATIRIDNSDGRLSGVFESGRTVKILRNGREEFRGVVEPRDHEKATDNPARLTVKVKHIAWSRLEQHRCDTYDFDEAGSGLADAVVNPWQWEILRNPNADVDGFGQRPGIDGFRPDQCLEAIIGTKLLHHNYLHTGKFFLKSSQSGSDLAIFKDDSNKSQKSPHLQLALTGDGTYKTSGSIESIPIYNGDPNIDEMGNISNVSLTVWGVRDSNNNDPTIEACRNADQSTRTYSTLTQDSFTASAETGLDKWEFLGDLSGDGASNKNEFGYKISLSGDGTDTTAIFALLFEVTTESDTDITVGRVATYSDSTGSTDPAKNFIQANIGGGDKTRADALADIQGLTVSDPDVNPTPHWDVRLSSSLELFFDERLGQDLDKVWTFGDSQNRDGALQQIGHTFEGDQIYYQVVGLGAGSGVARHRIVSKSEFSNGGLYFSDLDPDDGAKFGEAAKVGVYDDSNIDDLTSLLRRARAFAKLHAEPIETYTVSVEPDYNPKFSTFDSIMVDSPDTETDMRSLRVVGLKRTYSTESGESWTVDIGNRKINVADDIANLQGQVAATNIQRQARVVKSTEGGKPLKFSNSVAGKFAFTIEEPEPGTRYLLTIRTVERVNHKTSGDEVFRGDDGTGDPIYATNVRTHVDPDSLDSDGNPTGSSRGEVPVQFGKETAKTAVQDIDITDYLVEDSNNLPAQGVHEIVIDSTTSSSPNSNGVGAADVILKIKRADNQEGKGG